MPTNFKLRVGALRCAVFLAFLVSASVSAPTSSAYANTYGTKSASVEFVATLFRSVCLATATSFSGFESILRAKGFSDDGQGDFVDGVHDITFRIWKGEGQTFCTVFYVRPLFLATPNASHRNLARTFTEIGVPVQAWVPTRYDEQERRYSTPIAKDLSYEHRLMQEANGRQLMRAVLVVPDK